jgi:hypothetical protein
LFYYGNISLGRWIQLISQKDFRAQRICWGLVDLDKEMGLGCLMTLDNRSIYGKRILELLDLCNNDLLILSSVLMSLHYQAIQVTNEEIRLTLDNIEDNPDFLDLITRIRLLQIERAYYCPN